MEKIIEMNIEKNALKNIEKIIDILCNEISLEQDEIIENLYNTMELESSYNFNDLYEFLTDLQKRLLKSINNKEKQLIEEA